MPWLRSEAVPRKGTRAKEANHWTASRPRCFLKRAQAGSSRTASGGLPPGISSKAAQRPVACRPSSPNFRNPETLRALAPPLASALPLASSARAPPSPQSSRSRLLSWHREAQRERSLKPAEAWRKSGEAQAHCGFRPRGWVAIRIEEAFHFICCFSPNVLYIEKSLGSGTIHSTSLSGLCRSMAFE